ncbi:NADH-quinone oxidoreductase subunit L [Desulfomonile tiedjei]|uniref:NADH dehydrogenase subunit L n=1 Tax=Desulfomonile tiedjei (strain ATCC 49306 / DSM 6799 / DCB-1) TaxID=706587 RepID=I4CCT0_DESTA|nr:NADH-quinone oxidoreductase subunit L [Desulfomonile tiedjei]AFM27371.1 NADH dehydrogenase subunit L [Desulfomonile tiedjei DSM 6799]
MFTKVWLIPALPFLGFLILALTGSRLQKRVIAAIGVGSVGVSAIVALIAMFEFMIPLSKQTFYVHSVGSWFNVAGFAPRISFYFDALSLTMAMVVTVVGFFIHLYSAEYMIDEEDYQKFFAYMNLFVGFMLVLVLADNMLLLYLGWEGVGICSYLLIGFWYKNPENGYAAIKAFVITRIGDTALALGIFFLFAHLGTLQIQEIITRASIAWYPGSQTAVLAATLILIGALGKSAQLPLQTWLPDAMAGPTPVSALIHAATMVTAGVYLIARTNVLFSLAPPVQTTVATIGLLTLLIAGFSALVQTDIKRVLAYSTMSQIGYMFLALGVGAWSAAIFHFFTHAFFKSVLFLSAGVVITAMHHEQNIFKMGGLRKKLPVAFWTFLIGSGSLAAIPLITGGFYSKDAILLFTWSSEQGNPLLWLGGVLGAFITSLYIFRVVFLVFFGHEKSGSPKKPGLAIVIPLAVLAGLSVVSGFLETPRVLGHVTLFTDFLQTALPAVKSQHMSMSTETVLALAAAIVSLSGVLVGFFLYIEPSAILDRLAATRFGSVIHEYWYAGFGFDWLYRRVFIVPFVWISSKNRADIVDSLYAGIAKVTGWLNGVLSRTQTGLVRHYAVGIAVGAILAAAFMVFL